MLPQKQELRCVLPVVLQKRSLKSFSPVRKALNPEPPLNATDDEDDECQRHHHPEDPKSRRHHDPMTRHVKIEDLTPADTLFTFSVAT